VIVVELRRDHFIMLLNALDSVGVETVTVDHPSDDVGTILEVHLDDESPTATVSCRTQPEEYEETRASIRLEHGSRPYEDLPEYHELVVALTAAGVVDLANQADVEAYLDEVCYPAVGEGEPPVMIGIDANVFAWDFPETLGIDHRSGSTDDAGRRPTSGYALSNGVSDELHWEYSHYRVEPLVEAFGDEFERLEDQPGGSKRVGHLGMQEYQSLIATRNVDLVDSQPGDGSIIEGYAEYQSESRKRPLLLSNDYEFVERAQAADLLAQHLAFQSALPRRTTATWAEVADALYYLAVLFGVIRLPKVTLYGAWEDKRDRHWQANEIDVVCRGTQANVREPLVRHRRLAAAFDEV
jgi:hypothetical protein